MINKISHPIIILKLESLEVSVKWHLHYLGVEKWVIIKLIMWHQRMVMDYFNLLIQLSKFPLDLGILDGREP